MLEDKLLIWKFNRRDPQALRRIYEKYKNYLVTLAAALLSEKTTAEKLLNIERRRLNRMIQKLNISVSQIKHGS